MNYLKELQFICELYRVVLIRRQNAIRNLIMDEAFITTNKLDDLVRISGDVIDSYYILFTGFNERPIFVSVFAYLRDFYNVDLRKVFIELIHELIQ